MPLPLPVDFVGREQSTFQDRIRSWLRRKNHSRNGPWPTTAMCPKCAGPLGIYDFGLCETCRIGRYAAIRELKKGAHNKVAKAKKEGLIPLLTDGKTRCIDCGSVATLYDHRDYSKPLSVDPVCGRCNKLRGHAIEIAEYVAKNPSPREVMRQQRRKYVA